MQISNPLAGALFVRTRVGWTVRTKTTDLAEQVRAMPPDGDALQRQAVINASRATGRTLSSIATLIERSERSRLEAARCDLDDVEARLRWGRYCASDFRTIIIEARTIIDLIRRLVIELTGGKPPVPAMLPPLLDSWVRHDEVRRQWPKVADLLSANREWLISLNKLRNTLVHEGGDVSVFGRPGDGHLAQFYDISYLPLVNEQALEWRGGIVRFDLFAAQLMSRVLMLLDEFGAIYSEYRKLPSDLSVRGCLIAGEGVAILREWILASDQTGSAER